MSKMKFQDLINCLEQTYPPSLAEDWDQVGIHFGNPKALVRRVMAVLDIRHDTVEEAIQKQVDTLIVHHPPIFKPIQRFNTSDDQIALYAKLIKHNIKVYALHTNFDRAYDGMNDWLAQALNLQNISNLEIELEEGLPSIGRIGQLPQPLDRFQLLELLKQTYHRTFLTVIEAEPKETYQTIAIVGGSGAEFVDLAAEQDADVFITGDITYHKGHTCYDTGIMTVDAGHYIEAIFIEKMADKLYHLAEVNEWTMEVVMSRTSTNPFRYE